MHYMIYPRMVSIQLFELFELLYFSSKYRKYLQDFIIRYYYKLILLFRNSNI